MADNVVLNSGSGGDTIAADDDGTAKHQYVKVEFGADNTQTPVDSSNPLPVTAVIADTSFAVADGNALGEGVLIQGDDGTDRKNINVDATTGDVQVDVTNTVTVDLGANNDVTVQGEAAENDAVSGNPVLTGGRYDSTPRTLGNGDVGAIALDADGAVQVSDGGNTLTVDGTVSLSATDNDVLDNIDTQTAAIQTAVEVIDNAVATEGSALGSGVLIQGDDGTDRTNVLVDTDGHLQVDVLTVANSGTHTDDAAFTPGTDDGVPMFGMFDDTTPDSVDEGDAGVVRMSANRNLYNTIRDAAGNERGVNVDASNRLTVLADLGATDNAVLDSIQTAVETIDDAVATEGSALGSGVLIQGDDGTDRTNVLVDTDGHLQVDVLSGGGSGTQYTEDDAAATNPVGGVNILVRDDTPGTLTSTDGDNVAQRGTNYGAAFCQIVDSSGNFVDSFGGSGGTAAADDADFTAGTTQGTPFMGAYQSTPTNVTDGDLGIVNISQDRRLHTDAVITGQDADITIADGGNSITVDGTVSLSATDNAVLDNIDSNTDFGAQTGGGTEASALRVTIANNSTGVLSVDDNGSTLSIDDGGGTITVDGTVTANAGTGTMTVDLGSNNDVQGQVAHDAAAASNPLLGGARATNSVEGLTQVANADSTYVASDLNGVLLSRPHTTPEEHISERISNTNGTSTNFTNFNAGGAGIHNYVCDVTITNTSATDAYVDLRDGSAGSVIWTFPAPANSGATHSFSLPLKGAANTALAYDVSAAITTMYVSVNGYQAQG